MATGYWDILLSKAEAIEQLDTATPDRVGELTKLLDSVVVAYEGSVDPVTSYPEYANLALCRAIKKVLEGDKQH